MSGRQRERKKERKKAQEKERDNNVFTSIVRHLPFVLKLFVFGSNMLLNFVIYVSLKNAPSSFFNCSIGTPCENAGVEKCDRHIRNTANMTESLLSPLRMEAQPIRDIIVFRSVCLHAQEAIRQKRCRNVNVPENKETTTLLFPSNNDSNLCLYGVLAVVGSVQ